MKKQLLIVLLAVFMILPACLTSTAYGQGRRGQPNGDEQMGKRVRNLENLRILKLLEILDLDEKQNDQFISSFSHFRKEMRQINRNYKRKMESLAGYLRLEEISDEEIRDKIKEIEEIRDRRKIIRKQFFIKTSNVLSGEQLGKLILFEERFERELLESVRAFRERRNADPNAGSRDRKN